MCNTNGKASCRKWKERMVENTPNNHYDIGVEVNNMVHKIGERIQRFRKEQAMSQEEFGAVLNVSRQAISKWENGDSLPDVYNLIAISRLFHISIDELVLGTPTALYSKNIIQDVREKRKKSLLYGRLCILLASLVLTPPLIIMDALNVKNPTFGAVAAGAISLVGIITFFAVHYFLKAMHLKEELTYLGKIKTEKLNAE